MITPQIRLLLAFAVVLMTRAAAVAQLPQAPPPHLTVAGVLEEYKRCGLPLPPPEAELVRVDDGAPARVGLCFHSPSVWPASFGLNSNRDRRLRPGAKITKVEPKPEAAEGITGAPGYWLCLTACCKARGWDDLAEALYTRAREQLDRPVDESLRDVAWYVWGRALAEPGTDRAEPTRRLKALVQADPRFQTAENRALVRDLELTLAPRTSKPGTVEALIDDLTEDPGSWFPQNTWRVRPWWDEPLPDGLYWKIVEKGFDAVPALLAHLDDRRLTRDEWPDGRTRQWHKTRVFSVVGELLEQLSGGALHRRETGMVDPDAAREWWAKAQKLGEERWVLDRVLTSPYDDESYVGPNYVLLRVARVKYPGRLPAVYRAAFRKPEPEVSAAVALELLASRVPRKQIAEVFLEGTADKDPEHRETALAGLARTDPAAFRPIFLRTMEGVTADTTVEALESDVAPAIRVMTRYIADRDCWGAVLAAVRRAPNLWLELLGAVSTPDEPGEEDAARVERLRFWLIFLDYPADRIAPNGVATEHLNRLLGLGLPAEWGNSIFGWLITRGLIHRAAERELARLKK